MRALLGVLLLVTLITSGCVGGADSSTSYSGSGSGEGEARATCRGDDAGNVRLNVDYDHTGTMEIDILDGDGTVVWDLESNGGNGDTEETLSGAPGTWIAEVERGEDFRGEYEVRLRC